MTEHQNNVIATALGTIIVILPICTVILYNIYNEVKKQNKWLMEEDEVNQIGNN